MASAQQTNRQQEDPYEVSPLSSDAGSMILHESWLSGRPGPWPQPPQQDSDQLQNNQLQNQHQQFAPNWPLAPVALADVINQPPPAPMPPNNTPVATPEDSLEDVSLDRRDPFYGTLYEEDEEGEEDEQPQHIAPPGELEERLQASGAQSASLAPPEEPRPSSFEIMGCHGRGHPGAVRLHGHQYGLNRTPTPYPSNAVPPGSPFAGTRHIQVIDNPEVAAGGRAARANQNMRALGTPQPGRQPSAERFSTKRLAIIIVASGSTLAGLLFLTQSIAVMTIFRASGEPLNPGFIVECVLSLAVLFLSIAGLVLVSVGRDFVFPYTLRSPFARRQPPQPKELELGSMNRPATADDHDVERGEVQHQDIPQPTLPRPVYQGPAESRELLLRAAAPTATTAPSTTHTSIATEPSEAVSASDSQH